MELVNEVTAGQRATCDPAALRQVLVNLASNAIRFNRALGRVCVRGVAASRAGCIELQVHDQGEGMHAAELAQIFQPFERLGRLPGVQAGSGLGLMTARALARAMGGELWLKSEKGIGTCAVLELPAAP